MTIDTNTADRIRPCEATARARARDIVAGATIPAYAERFPDQFEHAIDVVARMGSRCMPGMA